jgi:hypothetical protein
MIGAGEEEILATEQHALFEVTEGETVTEGVPEALILPFHNNRSMFPTCAEDYSLMERSYLISSFDMKTADHVILNPYELLLSDTRMPARLARKFDYFRADMTLKVQLVSAVTTYGLVTMYAIPSDASEKRTYRQDITPNDVRRFMTWSGHSGVTLAIADQEGVEFNYPWTNPEHCFALSDPATPDKLRKLLTLKFDAPRVKNITPGVMDPTVSVQVYASFRNVVLMGPRSTLTPTLGANFTKALNSKAWNHAMKLHGDRVNTDVAEGQMEMVMAAVQGIALATEATVAVSDLIQGMQNVKDDGKKLFEQHEPEQKQLHPELSDAGQSNQRNGVKQSVYGDLASLYNSNAYANLGDHANQVTPADQFVAETAVGHNVYDMIGRWFVNRMFLDWGETDERSYTEVVHPSPGDIIRSVPEGNTTDYGYLPFFSRFYRFWRGNMDYRLQFFGSDLITMRVLVNVAFSADSLGATTPTPETQILASGDIFSKTFTVRGTTTVEFSVPFVRPYDWDLINDLKNCNYLTVSVVDIVPEQVDGIDVSMPMLVSYRANPNFQFSSFTGGVCNGTQIQEAEGQGFVNGDNATSQECTIFDGSSAPPTVLDFRGASGQLYNLMRRTSEIRGLNAVNAAPGQYPGADSDDNEVWNDSFNQSRTLDKFASLFLWWTGSIRHKMYFKEFGTVDTLSVTLQNPTRESGTTKDFRYRPEYGQHATEAAIWPILEFEVPYLNRYTASQTFEYTSSPALAVTNPLPVELHDSTGMDVPEPTRHFVTIGNDFGFYFALPPPTVLFPLVRNNKHQFTPSFRNSFMDIADGQSWVSANYYLEGSTDGFITEIVRDLDALNLEDEPVTAIIVNSVMDLDGGNSGNSSFNVTFGDVDEDGLLAFDTIANTLRYELYVDGLNEIISSPTPVVINAGWNGGNASGTFTIQFRFGTPGGSGGDVTLAGYTADYPLWISEVKPPDSVPPPATDIVITDTNLSTPVWVSRVKPNQTALGVRKAQVSQPVKQMPSGLAQSLDEIYQETGLSISRVGYRAMKL